MAVKKVKDPTNLKISYGNSAGGWSRCYTCGKLVYTGMYDMANWAYKYSTKFCCSYTCKNKAPEVVRKKSSSAPSKKS